MNKVAKVKATTEEHKKIVQMVFFIILPEKLILYIRLKKSDWNGKKNWKRKN